MARTSKGKVDVKAAPLFDAFDCLSLAVGVLFIVACPYTKVEESFNLQATHDLLFHRTSLAEYDHLLFPGVVPRTFLGPLLLALLSAPFVAASSAFGLSKIAALYLVRATLCFLSVFALSRMRKSISSIFGWDASACFSILTCCQFHLLFYCSRTLPNTFALVLVTLGFHFWLDRRSFWLVSVFGAVMTIFRSEVVLLFGPMVFVCLAQGWLPFWRGLFAGIAAVLASLALCVSVDSLMWGYPCWAEGEVFWYNTYHNKSHNWGTSPFYWYFLSAIPRLLMGALPLAVYGVWADRRLRQYAGVAATFVLLYSFLPHKELRFIFYSVPLFNMMASVGLARIWKNRSKNTLALLCAAAILLGSFLCSAGILWVSAHNYPGGVAFARLHAANQDLPVAKVHIDVHSAMTGVSRFGELNPGWQYSKDEDTTDFSGFDFLLSRNETVPGFDSVDTIDAFAGLAWAVPLPRIRLSPSVYIHRNRRGG